tara:strand:+ start:5125 stop:5550 length:426 start_codon:yes stop_codon:yes gene_type:complete
MTHIMVEREGKAIRVPEATVANLIGLMEHKYQQERSAILADMEEVGASPEVKFEAITKLRDDKGLTTALLRWCFSLEGAVQVIKYLTSSEDHDRLLDAPPDELVYLALRLIGYEPSDVDGNSDEEDEQHPTNDRATSSRKS